MDIGYVTVRLVHICFLVWHIGMIFTLSVCLIKYKHSTTSIMSFITSSNC